MPATTSMLSWNSVERAGQETRPRSPPGMLPALKFRPVSWTPASVMAFSKPVTWASVGTEVSKGHQNSTASKPAAFAAAGRSSRGSSVRRMEQFTVYVIVGPSGEGLDPHSLASRSFRFRFVEFRFCFMKSLGKGGPGSQGVSECGVWLQG